MAFFIRPQTELTDRGACPSGVYEYTKTINIKESANFDISIFAAGQYKLFINGKYICEGPCRNAKAVRYFDRTKAELCAGENKILIIVVHVMEEQGFTTGHIYLKPELVFEAKSEKECFFTDESWKCDFIKNHKLRINDTYVFPFEILCGDKDVSNKVVEQGDSFDFHTAQKRPYGFASYRLEPRKIKMIAPAEKVELKEVRRGENFIEYDAGKYVTAKVTFDLAAHCDAKIIYAECYMFEDGKRNRGDTSGFIDGFFDKVSSGEHDFTYNSFWYRAFRYIRVETDTPEKVKSACGHIYHYPVEFDGSFECSDARLNLMNDISINTLLCCTTDVVVDCPYYEQQQYVMDSAVECSALMRLTSERALVEKCLDDFAASQQPNGLLCANYPCSMVQVIPGFSLFWVWLLKEYLDNTANTAYVRKHLSTLDKILDYFETHKSPEGLVTNSNDWDFIDWVPEWQRGIAPVEDGKPNTIYSLYLACALKNATSLAKACGRPHLATEYGERYDALCKAINENLYDEKMGMYHDGCGTFSMHTCVWAILSEIVTGEKAKKMAEKMELENIFKSSYAMNFFLFRALEKSGCYEKAIQYFDGWQKMIDLGCTTWCENPDEPRSECHAWSCAPLYEFSANILGVKTALEDEIIISPTTLGLEFAKGKVPTRFGIVSVEWTSKDGKFELSISSPDGVIKKLIAPNGEIVEFADGEKTCSFAL